MNLRLYRITPKCRNFKCAPSKQMSALKTIHIEKRSYEIPFGRHYWFAKQSSLYDIGENIFCYSISLQPSFIIGHVNNILLAFFSLSIFQSSFSILFTQLSYSYSLAAQNVLQPNTDFLNTKLCQHSTVHIRFLPIYTCNVLHAAKRSIPSICL
jgi:hypothetical protein